MANDITAMINALLCIGVVVTLMLYRRGDAQHRRWVALLAWMMTVSYSSVPFAYLCGIYPYSSWLIILGNLIVFIVLLLVRGNVGRLVDLFGR